jgi:hypothetical protein
VPLEESQGRVARVRSRSIGCTQRPEAPRSLLPLHPLLESLVKRLLRVDALLARRTAEPAAHAPGDVYPPLDGRHHHGAVGRARPYTPRPGYRALVSVAISPDIQDRQILLSGEPATP